MVSTKTDPVSSSERSGVTDSVRVQILAAEHWDRLATRSMTWNQIFSRASMFITMLSAVVVALALIAQATNFDGRFRLFALLLLPVLLVLGIATFVHLGEANGEDARLQMDLARLRQAYLDLAPEVRPYFSAIPQADPTSFPPSVRENSGYTLIHFLGATPSIVATINVVVTGVIAALIATSLRASDTASILVGVVAAILAAVGHAFLVSRTIQVFRQKLNQPNHTPPGDGERQHS